MSPKTHIIDLTFEKEKAAQTSGRWSGAICYVLVLLDADLAFTARSYVFTEVEHIQLHRTSISDKATLGH